MKWFKNLDNVNDQSFLRIIQTLDYYYVVNPKSGVHLVNYRNQINDDFFLKCTFKTENGIVSKAENCLGDIIVSGGIPFGFITNGFIDIVRKSECHYGSQIQKYYNLSERLCNGQYIGLESFIENKDLEKIVNYENSEFRFIAGDITFSSLFPFHLGKPSDQLSGGEYKNLSGKPKDKAFTHDIDLTSNFAMEFQENPLSLILIPKSQISKFHKNQYFKKVIANYHIQISQKSFNNFIAKKNSKYECDNFKVQNKSKKTHHDIGFLYEFKEYLDQVFLGEEFVQKLSCQDSHIFNMVQKFKSHFYEDKRTGNLRSNINYFEANGKQVFDIIPFEFGKLMIGDWALVNLKKWRSSSAYYILSDDKLYDDFRTLRLINSGEGHFGDVWSKNTNNKIDFNHSNKLLEKLIRKQYLTYSDYVEVTLKLNFNIQEFTDCILIKREK